MTQITTTTTKPSALAVMAARVNIDPAKLHETLKNTAFKGANDHELVALVLVANEYNLNPLVKQIYAFPAKGGGVVPVVGIDGWLKIINDHPQFDGMETVDIIEDGTLRAVECKIYRKDRKYPTKIREYLSECRRKTEPWEQMPQRMLRHKAIMQCARVAFGIGGITDEDEASSVRMVSGSVVEGGDEDPLTAGIKPKAKKKPEPEPEALELNNDLTLDEQIAARAKAMDIPVAALIIDCAEAGLIPELPLDKLTDEQKREILK